MARGGKLGALVADLAKVSAEVQKALLADGRAGGEMERGSSTPERARGGPRRRAAADHATLPGDWTCNGCGFGPNFAARVSCWECGKERGRERGARGERGPMGAGGSRPMLGGGSAGKGRGKDEEAGSRGRKSGGGEASGRRSSPEAHTAGRRGSGSRNREGDRSGSNTRPAGSKAQTSDGDDGFTEVRRKGWGPRRGHRDGAGNSAGRENGEAIDNGRASESGSDWQASDSDHGESDGD